MSPFPLSLIIVAGFTGVDAPYEAPLKPEIVLQDFLGEEKVVKSSDIKSTEEMSTCIFQYMLKNGYLSE